jgi:hypothetical protein
MLQIPDSGARTTWTTWSRDCRRSLQTPGIDFMRFNFGRKFFRISLNPPPPQHTQYNIFLYIEAFQSHTMLLKITNFNFTKFVFVSEFRPKRFNKINSSLKATIYNTLCDASDETPDNRSEHNSLVSFLGGGTVVNVLKYLVIFIFTKNHK